MKITSELAIMMKNRESFYNFLSRLYEKEVSLPMIEQMKAMVYPETCSQIEMQEGYLLLKNYFLNHEIKQIEEDLAADYAKVFLAAGETKGNAAFPYESVYTSKEKLIMQDAWEQVRQIYAEKGLSLSTLMSDIKEDHIAMELKYMAYLSKSCEEEITHEGLQEQRTFLKTHLLNWTDSFLADIEKYARSDFYKAIGKLTLGYLKYDAELLESIVCEDEENQGVSYTLSNTAMDCILDEWKSQYRIFAPKIIKKRGSKGQDVVRYKEIQSMTEIAYDRQSDFSAKEVYYPIMQTMFYFNEESCKESQIDTEKGLLLFLHPCDINAFKRLDNIFLKNGAQEDLYYKRLREKVKIILLECTESYKNCFCVSMGSNVAKDYSMAVRLGADEVTVQVKEKEFEPYFVRESQCSYTPDFIKHNEKKVVLPVIQDKETLKVASSLQYWKKFDGKCISCGGCNTVCPTCSCFDTVDVIYNETSREGERRRVWSSCMLDTFTMTAGGSRARKTAGANMRFKALHKVYDYKKRFGTEGNMCVGCGRCMARCPKEISFVDTINEFRDELEKATKQTGGR